MTWEWGTGRLRASEPQRTRRAGSMPRCTGHAVVRRTQAMTRGQLYRSRTSSMASWNTPGVPLATNAIPMRSRASRP